MFGKVDLRIGIALVIAASLLSARSGMAGDAKAPTDDRVAVVNGTAVTEDELLKASAGDLEKLELQRMQFKASLERSHHQILEWNLSRLIESKVLAAEAAKQGMTVEALLAKELAGKVQDPTQVEVNAYYETNRARIGKPMETVSTQIFQYLRTENYNKVKSEYVERLKKDYGVSVYLEPLRAKVEPDGRPSLGPENASVIMIEFADFQCPFCANLSRTLHVVLNNYGKDVRLVYRQFPLSQIHPYAQEAAEASLCADEQGHFWEMHDLMFQDQGQLKEEDLRADATKLSLNTANFDQCLNSHRYASKVQEDLREGASLGVSGTPAIFINGRMLSGAQSYEEITKIIQEELTKKTE